jgi:predicted nucleic acid-binding protein
MKTYVFDASALFAFLQKEAGALKVNDLIKDGIRGHTRLLMSAVNYGEVYGLIRRQHGADRALTAIHAVSQLPIEVLDATSQRACQAAELKARHKLYYADSFAAALAMEHEAALVTSDSDFRKLGHGFPVVWLKGR